MRSAKQREKYKRRVSNDLALGDQRNQPEGRRRRHGRPEALFSDRLWK